MIGSSSDPYAILGVTPNASEGEIRKKYRKLCKQFHPDLNQGDPEAAEIFKEVTRAYETILSGMTPESADRVTTGDFPRGDQESVSEHPFFGFFHAVRAYCIRMEQKEESETWK